jgi:ribosomal protein S18 acetylase RimI-like enzyme
MNARRWPVRLTADVSPTGYRRRCITRAPIPDNGAAMATASPVRRATRDEIPTLAAVLARAFAADPFFSYLAGDAPERSQRMRDGWAGILRYASARLSATWTTDDRSGAAIWIPPGRDASSLLDQLRLIRVYARLIGWRRMRQASDAIRAMEERRAAHVPEPHFYLAALGVEPKRQGEGIGSALLAPVLAEADAAGVACYLETATGRNVLLYERHGFDVVEELVLPRTDVHGWLMRRPANAGPPAAAPGTSPSRSESG